MAGDTPGLNRQSIDASELPVKALEATGVRFVITTNTRTDLEWAASDEDTNLCRVPHPAPRAEFFEGARAEFVDDRRISESFAADPRNRLLLSPEARKYSTSAASNTTDTPVIYLRPSSDEILLRTSSGEPGFAHVLEAYDPGWTATMDTVPAPVLPANGFAMAVPVPAGSHTVRFALIRSPGRTTGAGLSLLSLALLAALIASA